VGKAVYHHKRKGREINRCSFYRRKRWKIHFPTTGWERKLFDSSFPRGEKGLRGQTSASEGEGEAVVDREREILDLLKKGTDSFPVMKIRTQENWKEWQIRVWPAEEK